MQIDIRRKIGPITSIRVSDYLVITEVSKGTIALINEDTKKCIDIVNIDIDHLILALHKVKEISRC